MVKKRVLHQRWDHRNDVQLDLPVLTEHVLAHDGLLDAELEFDRQTAAEVAFQSKSNSVNSAQTSGSGLLSLAPISARVPCYPDVPGAGVL
jgi:hypothetical protein